MLTYADVFSASRPATAGAVEEEGERQTRELHLGVDVLHVLLQVYISMYNI
jgi:hypothetical protein